MASQLDAHFSQYAASVEAMKSLRFPTQSNEPAPAVLDCIAYADRLADLETNLLCKRDQIDLLWMRYRACVIAGQQPQAVECIELAAAISATPTKQFAFAKLPQIGHADDDMHQARVMVEAAEDEYWPVAIKARAMAAIKSMRRAARTT